MTDFEITFNNYKEKFEEYLSEYLNALKCKPEILLKSLKYSLQLKSKRIRSVIMFAVGELLGIDLKQLKNFALALEFIHTYSLIHDDLPDMDNDDFRRGKPSNHKVFGNANAILAGDGLLNTAYSLLFDECQNGGNHISAAKNICECAGINGMIAGQSADLLHENDDEIDEDTLDFIYKNKTEKLFVAATLTPSILLGGKYYPELKLFGEKIGYLFQLTDDILDVEGNFESLGKTIGKDNDEGKYTAIKLYGIAASKVKSDICYDECIKILEALNGDTAFLKDLTSFVRQRIY